MKSRRSFIAGIAKAALAMGILANSSNLVSRLLKSPESIPNPAWETSEYELFYWYYQPQYGFISGNHTSPILHLVESGAGKLNS
jgi:hypothetical protein